MQTDLDLYKESLDNAISVAFVTDRNSMTTYANNTALQLFAYTVEDLQQKRLRDFIVDSKDHDTIEMIRQEVLCNGKSRTVELPLITKNGEKIPFLVLCKAIMNNEYFLWSGVDVRSLKETEDALATSLQELRSREFKLDYALDCAGDFMWEIDTSFQNISFSKNFEKAIGISEKHFKLNITEFFHQFMPKDAKRIRKRMQDYIDGKVYSFEMEHEMRHINGEIRHFLARGKFYDAERTRIYGISIDITKFKQYEKRLTDLAYKDKLTGLYNMQYLKDKLADEVRQKNISVAGLMVLDICSFRNINEAYGHDFGDEVLLSLVKILKKQLGDATLIRVSGDEFLAVFDTEYDAAMMHKIAENIFFIFNNPILLKSQPVYLNLKIGIALADEDTSDILRLLKDAEIALYYAKMDDLKHCYLLNEQLRNRLDDKVNLEIELRSAINQNEFILYYQPKMDTKGERLIGCEALIRWQHPQKGLVPPLSFIPLAEESGLIVPIGEFVIETAAKQWREWHDKGHDIFISVNVSAKQFLSPEFPAVLDQAMIDHGMPPENLIIEITESILIYDFDYIRNLLESLREKHIRVSLDDFGTGYSSLSYLGKLPLSNLKIDKAFLDNVLVDTKHKAILESIISLAHRLDMFVTAEGVEKPKQLSLLQEYECDVMQGYLFSKPLPPEQFELFMSTHI